MTKGSGNKPKQQRQALFIGVISSLWRAQDVNILAVMNLLLVGASLMLLPRLMISLIKADSALVSLLPAIDILSSVLAIVFAVFAFITSQREQGTWRSTLRVLGNIRASIVMLILLFIVHQAHSTVTDICYGLDKVADTDTILVNIAHYEGETAEGSVLNTWATQLQNEISETIRVEQLAVYSLPESKVIDSADKASALNSCTGAKMTIYWGGVGDNLIEVFYQIEIDSDFPLPIPEKSYLRASENITEWQNSSKVVDQHSYNMYVRSAGDTKYVVSLLAGYVQGTKGEYAKAIQTLTYAISLVPPDRNKDLQLDNAYAHRSDVYEQLNLYSEAFIDINKAIELNPRADHFVSRGILYGMTGNNDAALVDINTAIQIDSTSKYAYLTRSFWYAINKQYENAYQDATTAIQIDPKWSRSYAHRADVALMLHQYNQALSDIDTAVSLSSGIRKQYMQLSQVLIYSSIPGKEETAIRAANAIIAKDPSEAVPYVARSYAFARVGNYKDAIADLNTVVLLAPDEPLSYYVRGYRRFHMPDETPEAVISDFTRVIELDPGLTNAYLYRAAAYAVNGEYAESLADIVTYEQMTGVSAQSLRELLPEELWK